MKRRYVTTLTTEECKKFLKENVDMGFAGFGEERFVGWSVSNVFSLSYRSGRTRMYNPIYNKVIGRFDRGDGDTYVVFRVYRGLTDLLSLWLIFVGSFIILSVKFSDLNALSRAGLSMLCCLFASVITYVFTRISKDGKAGEQRLIEFVERNFELKSPNAR